MTQEPVKFTARIVEAPDPEQKAIELLMAAVRRQRGGELLLTKEELDALDGMDISQLAMDFDEARGTVRLFIDPKPLERETADDAEDEATEDGPVSQRIAVPLYLSVAVPLYLPVAAPAVPSECIGWLRLDYDTWEKVGGVGRYAGQGPMKTFQAVLFTDTGGTTIICEHVPIWKDGRDTFTWRVVVPAVKDQELVRTMVGEWTA